MSGFELLAPAAVLHIMFSQTRCSVARDALQQEQSELAEIAPNCLATASLDCTATPDHAASQKLAVNNDITPSQYSQYG